MYFWIWQLSVRIIYIAIYCNIWITIELWKRERPKTHHNIFWNYHQTADAFFMISRERTCKHNNYCTFAVPARTYLPTYVAYNFCIIIHSRPRRPVVMNEIECIELDSSWSRIVYIDHNILIIFYDDVHCTYFEYRMAADP